MTSTSPVSSISNISQYFPPLTFPLLTPPLNTQTVYTSSVQLSTNLVTLLDHLNPIKCKTTFNEVDSSKTKTKVNKEGENKGETCQKEGKETKRSVGEFVFTNLACDTARAFLPANASELFINSPKKIVHIYQFSAKHLSSISSPQSHCCNYHILLVSINSLELLFLSYTNDTTDVLLIKPTIPLYL